MTNFFTLMLFSPLFMSHSLKVKLLVEKVQLIIVKG